MAGMSFSCKQFLKVKKVKKKPCEFLVPSKLVARKKKQGFWKSGVEKRLK